MNRGVSLLEMIVVLLILGILAGAAVPTLGSLRDRYAVQAAAADIAGAHNRARIRAVLEGKVTELEIRADSLILSVRSSGGPTMVWSTPGPQAAGIAFTSPPRTLAFAPTGVTMGFSNASFVLTKNSARRQVVVSRLGRVRVIP
jgi:prepilin-type N-terminal cleavage/methylation domain-containing protein